MWLYLLTTNGTTIDELLADYWFFDFFPLIIIFTITTLVLFTVMGHRNPLTALLGGIAEAIEDYLAKEQKLKEENPEHKPWWRRIKW